MGKNIVGQAREYRELMQDIIAQGLPIYIRNKEKKVIDTYEIQQGEEFRQVWTNDKTARYYKVRSEIKPYYFVSNYGTVVSLYGLKANLIVLVPRTDPRGYSRLIITPQTRTKGEWTTTPEHLVGLTFECDAESTALKNMQKYGIDALRQSKKGIPSPVQLHHIRGHKGGESENELMAHHMENCRVDNLEFISAKVHIQLTNAQPIVNDEDQLEKELERMLDTEKVLASHGLIDHAVVFDLDIEKDGDSYTVTKRTVEEPTHIRAAIKPINAEAKAAEQATRQQDARYIVDIARRDPEPEDGMLIESEDKQRLYSVTLL